MASMWMVMIVKKKAKISVPAFPNNLEQDVDLTLADGMVGAIPVFNTKDAAEKFADGVDVVEVEMA